MRLPTPTAEDVACFRALYERVYRVTLSDEEALDLCLRLIQFIYLTAYALPDLREKEQRIR